ncbi:MAG TPA: flippase [Anaeromyxobacteraceae bacterium]|nr:flippase [Anaeromyxobacteraceae bacterium]
MTSVVAQASPAPSASSHDAGVAVRNGVKLGLSLVLTWSVALGVRILLPRYLGPSAFGPMNFADAFAATVFVALNLGTEMYIRKEIPVHPAMASDFFGGTLLVRLGISVLLFAGIAVGLTVSHRPPELRQLVYLFGVGQVFFTLNGTLSAYLHAHGTVDGLSVMNVVSKVLWGTGILAGIATHHAVVGVALAFILSEAVKSAVLWRLAARHLHLQLRFNWPATWVAVRAGLPFYLNAVAFVAYGRLDVTMLEFITNNAKELGWYGAASNLATLTLLIVPVIGWVLMPFYARALHRSREEMERALARSMELILAVAIPGSLLIVLGAELWIRIMFGEAFSPAALPLRIMSPIFVLTYVATISAIGLILLGRGWTVTKVSLMGVVLAPLLALLFIPLGAAHLGGELHQGGPGAGAALANLVTESCVTVVMTTLIGWKTFDRTGLVLLGRTAVVCALVVALHFSLSSLGHARLVADALAYVALAVALRAVRWREMFEFARTAWKRPRDLQT